jgi:hypothetical protein
MQGGALEGLFHPLTHTTHTEDHAHAPNRW